MSTGGELKIKSALTVVFVDGEVIYESLCRERENSLLTIKPAANRLHWSVTKITKNKISHLRRAWRMTVSPRSSNKTLRSTRHRNSTCEKISRHVGHVKGFRISRCFSCYTDKRGRRSFGAETLRHATWITRALSLFLSLFANDSVSPDSSVVVVVMPHVG